MKIIACYQMKGGVGKTTTAVNLAHMTSLEGKQTILWDLDPQGSASHLFRMDMKSVRSTQSLLKHPNRVDEALEKTEFPGLSIIPSSMDSRKLEGVLIEMKKGKKSLRQLLVETGGECDLLILDLPPGLQRVHETALQISDLVLAPVIPDSLSLHSLEMEIWELQGMKKIHPRFLPFFNMVNRRLRGHTNICENRESLLFPFLTTEIPLSGYIAQMSRRKKPLASFAPRSLAARRYKELYEEIKNRYAAEEDFDGSSQSSIQ